MLRETALHMRKNCAPWRATVTGTSADHRRPIGGPSAASASARLLPLHSYNRHHIVGTAQTVMHKWTAHSI